MASLDQFLQDLDDLDDEQAEGADEEVQDEEVDEDEDIDMMGEDVQPASTSGLLASGRLDELIERIEDLMVQTGPTDSEAEYAAIVACNEMVIDADTEVMSIAKNIKDDYAKRFPELESLIQNPLDYARVVLKLGNETDLTQVDLTGILPSASIMVVTVTASTTAGTALPEAALQKVQDACEQVLKLSSHKQKMLAFVESRMATVAPNLSAIVGTQVAAKLIGAAGGLDKLAALPSTVLQVLGSKKRTGAALGGMSSNSGLEVKHAGFVQRCARIQNTPPPHPNTSPNPNPDPDPNTNHNLNPNPNPNPDPNPNPNHDLNPNPNPKPNPNQVRPHPEHAAAAARQGDAPRGGQVHARLPRRLVWRLEGRRDRRALQGGHRTEGDQDAGQGLTRTLTLTLTRTRTRTRTRPLTRTRTRTLTLTLTRSRRRPRRSRRCPSRPRPRASAAAGGGCAR